MDVKVFFFQNNGLQILQEPLILRSWIQGHTENAKNNESQKVKEQICLKGKT